MGVYGQFNYGDDVYGGLLQFISPDHGPVTGGTEVVITGSNFRATEKDDRFDDGVLNPGLWSALTSGDASSAIETTDLRLQSGLGAGDFAAVIGSTSLGDTDLEVSYEVVTPFQALPAPGDVELATLRLQIDANNYVQISRKTGVADRVEATAVIGGVPVETGMRVDRETSGTLRIVRRGSVVYLYSGNVEILRRAGFSAATAVPVLRVHNLSSAYPVQTAFSDFFIHTMVVFDLEPMLDASVDLRGKRIMGTTPRGIIGSATIYFATWLTSLSVMPEAFEYVDPALFVLGSWPGASLAFSDDPTLRNLQTGRPGFLK